MMVAAFAIVLHLTSLNGASAAPAVPAAGRVTFVQAGQHCLVARPQENVAPRPPHVHGALGDGDEITCRAAPDVSIVALRVRVNGLDFFVPANGLTYAVSVHSDRPFGIAIATSTQSASAAATRASQGYVAEVSSSRECTLTSGYSVLALRAIHVGHKLQDADVLRCKRYTDISAVGVRIVVNGGQRSIPADGLEYPIRLLGDDVLRNMKREGILGAIPSLRQPDGDPKAVSVAYNTGSFVLRDFNIQLIDQNSTMAYSSYGLARSPSLPQAYSSWVGAFPSSSFYYAGANTVPDLSAWQGQPFTYRSSAFSAVRRARRRDTCVVFRYGTAMSTTTTIAAEGVQPLDVLACQHAPALSVESILGANGAQPDLDERYYVALASGTLSRAFTRSELELFLSTNSLVLNHLEGPTFSLRPLIEPDFSWRTDRARNVVSAIARSLFGLTQ